MTGCKYLCNDCNENVKQLNKCKNMNSVRHLAGTTEIHAFLIEYKDVFYEICIGSRLKSKCGYKSVRIN